MLKNKTDQRGKTKWNEHISQAK